MNEMLTARRLALYCRVTMCQLITSGLFTVRVWDGMDGCWCDVETNVELAFALRRWCKETKDGTANTNYHHIDYYCIFPADTKMLWSGDFTMRGDDD